MIENPFVLEPYFSEEYFCDRKKETKLLRELLHNRQNVTLISPRRYGKTGLIYHLFDSLSKEKEYDCYYVDIYSASNIDDFITLLSESVVNVLKKKSLIDKFISALGAIRPILTIDPTTGKYSLSYSFQSEAEKKFSLKAIFTFLESEKRKIILAIDEFQQIRYFEEKRVEALLRTYIQPLHNVRFIFCGSQKHMMVNMFTDPESPFYESSECVFLERIDEQIYKDFVRQMFQKGEINIEEDALDFIMQWTLRHTYYVQNLCNHLYSLGEKNITCDLVRKTTNKILKLREYAYLERRNLITSTQWKYLKAVAKEEIVTQPTSSSFLSKYSLGAPSTAQKTLKALVDKEMILETTTQEGKQYRVYNVFFLRWLAQL